METFNPKENYITTPNDDDFINIHRVGVNVTKSIVKIAWSAFKECIIQLISPLIDATGAIKVDKVRDINFQSDTSYTIVEGDLGKLVSMKNEHATIVTVPLDDTADFYHGSVIELEQRGDGSITFAGETKVLVEGEGEDPDVTETVTINSKDGDLTIAGKYVKVTLIKIEANTWDLFGDLKTLEA